MKYRKACSVFAISVGLLMIIMWAFFILAGMVPEFETKPAEIILHIIAELSTGIILLSAGVMTLRNSNAARWLYPLSIGMLLYTLVVSPGYYLQSGDFLIVIMFAALFILSLIFIYLFVKCRTDEN